MLCPICCWCRYTRRKLFMYRKKARPTRLLIFIKTGYLNSPGVFLQKTTIFFNFDNIFFLWSKKFGPPITFIFLFNTLKTKMERIPWNTCLMLQQKLKQLITCSNLSHTVFPLNQMLSANFVTQLSNASNITPYRPLEQFLLNCKVMW